MEHEYGSEMERIEMEERIHVMRDDLSGDAPLSAELVKAARDGNWAEAEKLLDGGADPRLCRCGDAYGVESALFYAIRGGQYDLARELYEAGDRLDDLIVESSEKMLSEAIAFLAHEMREGRNYFYDADKPLSECCRCSDFSRIGQLIGSATPEELNKSAVQTVRSWIYNFRRTERYAALLEDLRSRGARIAKAEKEELFAMISRRFDHCPAVLHPGRENVEKIIAIINRM